MGTLAKTTLGNSSQILAPTAYLKGVDITSTEIDLRTKIEGFLKVGVGLFYASAYQTYGVAVIVRRKLYNSGTVRKYGVPYWSDRSRYGSTAGTGVGHCAINGAVSAAAVSIAWNGNVGTAKAIDDYMMFTGIDTALGSIASGAISPAHGCECARLIAVGTPMILDTGLIYDHHTAEWVLNASVFEIPLEGGYMYDLIIDYKTEQAGSGNPAIAFADLQTIDTYTSA